MNDIVHVFALSVVVVSCALLLAIMGGIWP